MNVVKNNVRLYATPKAVIANYLQLPGANRIQQIIDRVKNLDEAQVAVLVKDVITDFSGRHRNIETIFEQHVERICATGFAQAINGFSESRKLLLGSYFTKEYSIQASALFNPSIVAHPDQTNVQPGAQRFVMSLRATGEGHISSIVFKTGIVDDSNSITLDADSGFYTPLKKKADTVYSKTFIQQRLQTFSKRHIELPDALPEQFTAHELLKMLDEKPEYNISDAVSNEIRTILDSNYELEASHAPLTETVIFPSAAIESMGMEDVRFVRFEDGGRHMYYGTYTAYNGREIKTQLIETADFKSFNIRTLYGPAVSDKGMALFPEKVNGQYAMITRQGGEKISIMFSEDLYFWNSFQTLMEPRYVWEFVQLGNCGSPVKTEAGWLLLTHGVGPMRTYVISAVLLSLDDPTKIKARLRKPLIQADENEREGYVPNVVYTCGLLRHNDFFIIPYAVSDSATGFVTVSMQKLINEMLLNNTL